MLCVCVMKEVHVHDWKPFGLFFFLKLSFVFTCVLILRGNI